MYLVNFEEEKLRKILISKLDNEYANIKLMLNPRVIDIVKEIEKYVIKQRCKGIKYTDAYIYGRYVLPKIKSWIDNNNHFSVNEDGNVKIVIPHFEERDYMGKIEKIKEIRYNGLEDGMEKIFIYDYRKRGIRFYKAIRYIYDKNGIEIGREIEMLDRDYEGVKTLYSYRERLPQKPNIIKIIDNTKPTKNRGKVRYYDISNNRKIENLDTPYEEKQEIDEEIKQLTAKQIWNDKEKRWIYKDEGKIDSEDISKEKGRIEEAYIKELTVQEKEVILKGTNRVYKNGMSQLMGITVDREDNKIKG